MRISDWSSDVCSSDLEEDGRSRQGEEPTDGARRVDERVVAVVDRNRAAALADVEHERAREVVAVLAQDPPCHRVRASLRGIDRCAQLCAFDLDPRAVHPPTVGTEDPDGPVEDLDEPLEPELDGIAARLEAPTTGGHPRHHG